MTFELSALIATWIAIAILAFACAGLLRQIRELRADGVGIGSTRRLRQAGPPVGRPFDVEIQGWSPAKPSVLLFVDGNCATCEMLLPHLDDVAEGLSPSIDVFAVFRSNPNGYHSTSIRVVPGGIPTFIKAGITLTPFGVVTGAAGIVLASQPVGSPTGVQQLIQIARDSLASEKGS